MLTIEDAAKLQRSYRAHEEYRRPLNETTIIAMVGATAVGKNFLMDASGLPVVGTLTTREARPSDNPARYRYTSVAQMLKKIEAEEVVQYGVHAPNIYASELEDYTLGEPNVSDIFSHGVSDLHNKGFQAVKSVSVLSPKEQWFSQLMMRFDGMRVADAYSRLNEARQSLRWTRAQFFGATALEHLIIINDATKTDENIERLHDFANGKNVTPLKDPDIQDCIEDMESMIHKAFDRVSGRATL